MNRLLKGFLFILTSFLLALSSLFFFLFPANATNILSNPNFDGGTTDWAISKVGPFTTITYDSTDYVGATPGSVKTNTAGKNKAGTSTTVQTTSTIYTGSTAYLSFYYKKDVGTNYCDINTIEARIQPTGGSESTVWSHTGTASVAWTAVSNIDITSYITSSTTYTLTFYISQDTINTTSGLCSAWIDSTNLDVTPPPLTVGTTGTQVSTLQVAQQNANIGGAFTFVRNANSTTVTSITIRQTGTISDANISGLILHYKQEATCSTSIPVDSTVFNSTPGSFSSGNSTVTGSMAVGGSQICVYAEVDIGSGASVNNTVDLQITNPSTQVIVSEGTVTPATAVSISGSTTIVAQGFLSIDIVDASDQTVASPSVQFTASAFSWVDRTSTGTLGVSAQKIKVINNSVTPSWTLSIAATNGPSSLWESTSYSYDYNGTQSTGRLWVNPSAGTLTPGGGCSNTGVSLQSGAYFVSGSVDSINLVVAGGSAQTSCYWYVTSVPLIQDIPGRQASGNYSLSMTLTVI